MQDDNVTISLWNAAGSDELTLMIVIKRSPTITFEDVSSNPQGINYVDLTRTFSISSFGNFRFFHGIFTPPMLRFKIFRCAKA